MKEKEIEDYLLNNRTACAFHLFGVFLAREYAIKRRRYLETENPTARTFKAVEKVLKLHGVEEYSAQEIFSVFSRKIYPRFLRRLKEECGFF